MKYYIIIYNDLTGFPTTIEADSVDDAALKAMIEDGYGQVKKLEIQCPNGDIVIFYGAWKRQQTDAEWLQYDRMTMNGTECKAVTAIRTGDD